MKIAVTGASGLIGSSLVPALRHEGHDVLRLVRARPARRDEAAWDPMTGEVDMEALAGTEGIVHLAGAGLGRRWTESYKRAILESRVAGTDTISRAAAALRPAPRVLVSMSAIGYYGATGDRIVDEMSRHGDTFLADVCVRWEDAADPAREEGIRVSHPRLGLVATAQGGAFGPMMTVFRLGLGGRLGSGRQWWSLVSLEDTVRAVQRLLVDPGLGGPVNVTAPQPATNAEVTRALGEALHRPARLAVPGFALRAVLGGLAEDILVGQRVRPGRLLAAGFEFRHRTALEALRSAV